MTSITTTAERQFAVKSWLLGAVKDRRAAREEWAAHDVALLHCGGIFSAVRIPSNLVWAAAGTEKLAAVDAFLRRWFTDGAMFMDLHAHHYYALVPASTARQWNARELPGVECLGHDHYLGVPAVRCTEPRGRAYWCLSMDSPGCLCYVDEVEQLLRRAQEARGESVAVTASDEER
ncbi:hypothetical protein [Streptomyces sp. NPDC049915]|uniref:hypothetical protein n=1 Tax=Streptomyces sp. NPDC049915 TaxID=3155510 RepID=UPI003418EAC9